MSLSDELQQQLIEKTETISKNFKLQLSYYQSFVAVNAIKLNREIQVEKIKELMDHIKKNTSFFSPFRSQSFLLAALMTLHSEQPEPIFSRLKEHYDSLKKAGFRQTQYLPMASYCLDSILYDPRIQDMSIQTRSYKEALIAKSYETFTLMKEQHPWLTGGDDYALCVLLAHSHKNLSRVEYIFDQLNLHGLSKTNGLQSLSNILALSNEDENSLVQRLIQLKEQFKAKGLKFNDFAFPGLGLLVHLNCDEQMVEDIANSINALHKLKHYKWLDKSLLLLFVILLQSEQYKSELSQKTIYETTLSITIEQIVTAQTAIMIAMMSSTAATTAAT